MAHFPGVDAEAVQEARARTRQVLGAVLEEKASDEFCLAVARPVPVLGMREAMRVGPVAEPPLRSVVEFSPLEESVGRLPERVSPDTAEAVRKSLAGVVEELPAAEKALFLLLRQAGVKAARDDFYRSMGQVRDQIERAATTLYAGREAGVRIGMAAAPVQACWLNRTVRADADPRVIGDVAGDPAVQRIDLPRRLAPDRIEADVTLEEARKVREATDLTGRGVTVGVIDSEVALRHPGFQDRVIHRRNYTQEPFGVPGDHGTAVAGIIGADSQKFTGIAPEATIYNYKVLTTSTALHSEDFEGALAIQHALEDGVRVVNCSWGAGEARDGTSREARACDTAWRLGLTIVKSAGNRGPDAGTLTTPADAEGVIVVGATDGAGDEIGDYSSRGPTSDGRIRPHLVAPGGASGVGLTSALVTGDFENVGWGTSFAAPHVTGLLALLLEQNSELITDEQRQHLIDACVPLTGSDPNSQGEGLVSPTTLLAPG